MVRHWEEALPQAVREFGLPLLLYVHLGVIAALHSVCSGSFQVAVVSTWWHRIKLSIAIGLGLCGGIVLLQFLIALYSGNWDNFAGSDVVLGSVLAVVSESFLVAPLTPLQRKRRKALWLNTLKYQTPVVVVCVIALEVTTRIEIAQLRATVVLCTMLGTAFGMWMIQNSVNRHIAARFGEKTTTRWAGRPMGWR